MQETPEMSANLDQSGVQDLSLDEPQSESGKQNYQLRGEKERELTPEELEKLEKDKCVVNEFKQRRYEIEAKKNWDLFYRRNKANFFKDRYWTFREFDELNDSATVKILLEIGCGVGNFIFPLLSHNKSISVYACDFSDNAIALLKANPEYDVERASAFVCDVTLSESLRKGLDAQKRLGPYGLDDSESPVMVDVVTLIFVLSAIHPAKMRQAVLNIAQILKPGGLLLIRDYGVNDHSMIRFEPGHKLDDKFYVRQDGTRTFFFSLSEIDRLLLAPFSTVEAAEINDARHVVTDAPSDLAAATDSSSSQSLFDKMANEYVFRETVNVKENLRVPRVFVQSKFVRTSVPVAAKSSSPPPS